TTGGFVLAFHHEGELISGFYYIWASHLLQVALPLAAGAFLLARRMRAAAFCLAVLGVNAAYGHFVVYATAAARRKMSGCHVRAVEHPYLDSSCQVAVGGRYAFLLASSLRRCRFRWVVIIIE